MSDSPGPDGTYTSAHTGYLRAFGLWVKNHKIRAVLYAFLLYLIFELLTIPYLEIAGLRNKNPTRTALMDQRVAEAEDQGKTLKISSHWIQLSRIPRYALNAIIVSEDGTFYAHGGIDWFEVQESVERNLEEGRAARGASTITQQLAKNLYLSTSKTPMRKVKEVIITLLLENQLGKDRILELYVNLIEWGRGVFGIDAASKAYFGKSASDLTLDEAARLAAVIPSPLTHRPDSDSRYVLRRKQIVLSRLSARKTMTSSTNEETQPNTRQLDDSAEILFDRTGALQPEDSEQILFDTTGTPDLGDSSEGEPNGL